jgi:hypothetical protein
MSRENFEKWWSDCHSALNHRDILRACEKAWQACEAEQSKRIAKLEAENEALRNALANDTAKYMIKRVELEAQNAELAEALQKHGRHLADCAFLPNWIDHECNCGLFKLLNKTKECLAER